MICADPFTEPENIEFLNKTQIAELVEMDADKTYKMLNKLHKLESLQRRAEAIREIVSTR